MVFGHRNFWLLFRILRLIYFPTITNEETYVAGGVQRNRVFSRLSQISPRPIRIVDNDILDITQMKLYVSPKWNHRHQSSGII